MRTQASHRPLCRPAAGFTMVELLVAMFIFAIGLLGLASLQVVALSHNTGGRLKATASYIAQTVTDRMVSEGQITAAERSTSASGAATTTSGWTFIGAADGTAQAGPNTAILYDLNGKQIADPSTETTVFTVNWLSRTGTIDTGNKTGLQEFVVNVTWQEANPQKSNKLETKAISVSRYVRI